jgi:hypothetical protein
MVSIVPLTTYIITGAYPRLRVKEGFPVEEKLCLVSNNKRRGIPGRQDEYSTWEGLRVGCVIRKHEEVW